MALIKLNAVSLAYGHVPLLDKVDLQIEDNERVCLVGRNGTGKSTLMQIIRGAAAVDDGEVWRKPGLRIAWLAQEVPENLTQSVFDVVAAGLDEIGATLAEYHHLIQTISDTTDESVMDRLSELQHYLDTHDGWRLEQRVAAVISRLQLPEDVSLAELSGGMKRRVMLAQALVTEPDLLLLDEPTNHLDLAGIQWLEEFLLEWNGSLLFITHDRRFLQNVATRIIELDRGHLSSWPGDYQNFIEQKEHALSVEAEHNAKFDKKLAQEEVWIRQGVKARRTRNEGRVRALEALRRERSQRREQQGKVAMNLDSGETSGKIVIEVEHASVGYAGKPVIRDFSTRIMRGDKVGIIGPNGVGKTTLLKLLLGQLAPDSGKVTLGTKLEIAYFDQQREQLDANKTVLDNLNMGSDVVTVNGRDRHVMSYLQDFLFVPARVRSPVSSLSGGERNRLLLARLFTRPANVLVMDEPTNDLDVETLELLEELLIEYPGTLLLVSHDRTFLDNVITNSLVFEGDGRVEEYVGGYSDWLRQRDSGTQTKTTPVRQDTVAESAKNPDPMPANSPARSTQSEARPTRTRKLSYKQQRELEQLPGRIEALEIEQQELQAQMAAADFYKGDQESIAQTLARLEQVTQELETCLQRWVVLEGE